jgi:hypothetical protein
VPNLKSFAFGLCIESTRFSLHRPRRHRRRCARPAAAVGVTVGRGCVTPPPPPTSASAAAAALPRRRCSGRRWRRFHRRRRRDFAAGAPASLATARPSESGWLTDAQWHRRHILQNIKHPCNPIPVYCCISIIWYIPGIYLSY